MDKSDITKQQWKPFRMWKRVDWRGIYMYINKDSSTKYTMQLGHYVKFYAYQELMILQYK